METRAPISVESVANWCADTKVKDDGGMPLIVFHGGTRFDEFCPDPAAGAHYASDSVDAACSYAGQYPEKDAEIKPLLLRMVNPLDLRERAAFMQWGGADPSNGPFSSESRNMAHNSIAGSGSSVLQRAKDAGHDGLVFYDTHADGRGQHVSYAFFSAEQSMLVSSKEVPEQWWDYAVRRDGVDISRLDGLLKAKEMARARRALNEMQPLEIGPSGGR
jgi:hypothetical protein